MPVTGRYRRQRIVETVRERLREIRRANGYETDAGDHLRLGSMPLALGPDDPVPALALVVGRTETRAQGRAKDLVLPLLVLALVPDELDDPLTPLEALLGDIKRAMERPEDRTLGGLLAPLGLETGEAEPLERAPGSSILGLQIEFRAPYVERYGDPEA